MSKQKRTGQWAKVKQAVVYVMDNLSLLPAKDRNKIKRRLERALLEWVYRFAKETLAGAPPSLRRLELFEELEAIKRYVEIQLILHRKSQKSSNSNSSSTIATLGEVAKDQLPGQNKKGSK